MIRRLWAGDLNRALVIAMRDEFGRDWAGLVESALVAEHRYYVLLWQRRLEEARAYATRMIEWLGSIVLPAATWWERRGDAAFQSGDYLGALRDYEHSLGLRGDEAGIWLKLSDVHFKLGDLERERQFREKVYGTLREAD